jgi:hypothetical protein
MEMPKPSQEHQRLHALCGEWIGDETLSPSPWGPGGRAVARVTTRLELDGFYVVQDYVEEKDGRVTFRGHGLFSYDTQAREYCRYWFDSIGFVPDAPARGAWEGDTLTFRYSSPRGQARYTYRFESDRLHHLRLENSFDGGQKWTTFLEAIYRRVSADGGAGGAR